ncbi:MAG: ATP-binding protein [Akkermansia sp.]|nr:ATP-binding protein [Akkermansia sp.]
MDVPTYFPRTATDRVKYLSAHYPCILLTGARQVGKSTLLEELRPEGMNYVTLDDYLLAEEAKRDPIGFLQRHKAPLFIDEVQYAPELLRAIKMRVDAEKRNGLYWLAGSQHFHLMQGVSESLAGRVGILDLHSMSQRECLGLGSTASVFDPENPAAVASADAACDIHELYHRIWRGGYPVLSKDKALEPATFFDSYVRTYLERDVNQLAQVGNRAAFLKLMQSAAMRSGQQLVYTDLARDAEVSPNTAKAWVAMLEATGIISLLQPYSTNSTKRLTKTPKLYFMDTGLCSWLAGWQSPPALMNSPFAGAILETWVYGQLIRSFNHNGSRPRLYFFRDARGTAEVDFLLVQNGIIYPMEVKRSSSPTATDLRHTAKIPPGMFELTPGIIFSTAEQPYTLENGIRTFPVSML